MGLPGTQELGEIQHLGHQGLGQAARRLHQALCDGAHRMPYGVKKLAPEHGRLTQ